MKSRYQPIGGVYKYYTEAKPFLESIKYEVDTSMGNIDETDDLRIRIKRKYLLTFLEWFESMQNREYDPTREFYEELIKPGFLPEEYFRHLQYRKVNVYDEGIKWSEPLAINEYRYADIFQVDFNDEQNRFVKERYRDIYSDRNQTEPV